MKLSTENKVILSGVALIIIVVVLGIFGTRMALKDAIIDWNLKCAEKCLPKRCTPLDECEIEFFIWFRISKTFLKSSGGVLLLELCN